jgi:hypothetical protein
MAEKCGKTLVDKWAKDKETGEVVEVLSRGHFPTTAIVRANHGEYEIELAKLEAPDDL